MDVIYHRGLKSSSDDSDYNIARTYQFLTMLTSFSVVYCGISCYIYARPHDGPNGYSFVSKIRYVNPCACISSFNTQLCVILYYINIINRRLPLVGWYFRQPLKNRQSSIPVNDEELGLLNNDDNDIVNVKLEQDKHNNPKITMQEQNVTPPTIATDKYIIPGQKNLTLLLCALGLLVAYLTWGMLQERIMSYEYSDKYGNKSKFVYR